MDAIDLPSPVSCPLRALLLQLLGPRPHPFSHDGITERK